MHKRSILPALILAACVGAAPVFAAPIGTITPTETSIKAGFDRLQAAMDRDDDETSRQLADACLTAARENGSIALVAQALLMKGESQMGTEQDTSAKKYLLNALGLANALDNANIRANALNDLGILAERDGLGEAAEAYYRESLAIARTLSDPLLLDAVSFDLGAILYEKGDLKGGYALLEGVCDRSKTRHDDLNVVKAEVKLAEFERAMKQPDKAGQSANEALSISRKLAYRPTELGSLRVLALLALDRNDIQAAESNLQDALSTAVASKDKWAIASARYDLGEFYATKGRSEDAIRNLMEAQAAFRELGRKGFAEEIGKTLNQLDGGKQL